MNSYLIVGALPGNYLYPSTYKIQE